MQSLRIQTAAQIEIKLSKHRDLGTNSPLTIFQVAYLLDVLSRGEDSEEKERLPVIIPIPIPMHLCGYQGPSRAPSRPTY